MNPNSIVGHIREILKAAGQSALPPDRLVSVFFRGRKYLGSHDRKTIAEAVFGIIRHRRLFEFQLDRFAAERPDYAAVLDANLRDLPLVIAYLVSVDAGAESSPAFLPRSTWRDAFPGLEPEPYVSWLREHREPAGITDDRLAGLGIRYSFQDWMVGRLLGQFGDETEQLLDGLNRPAPITLRVNLLNATREECRARLRAEGIVAADTPVSPAGLTVSKRFNVKALESFREGWFEVQDEGSQIVGLLASPRRGDLVVDACAGAGGKSLHMADLMGNVGEIIALDVDQRRLDELAERARRAGRTIIRPLLSGSPQGRDYVGKADMVLVDAPCSGIGTIRRNPGLKWSLSESDIGRLAAAQRTILEESARFVKPGGTLLYVTCSLLKEENAEVVESFLSAHAGFSRASMSDHPLRALSPSGTAQLLLTPHRHGTDGFFMARMIASSDGDL